MERSNWPQMQEYWRAHSSRWRVDRSQDIDGLGNVCRAGTPLWFNRYYGRLQKKIYKKLFSYIPSLSAGARALDIGCGTGRWCRLLVEHGYQTVGIDLQPELIEDNKNHYPDCQFFYSSIQDYHPQKFFDLVSSVTVIQHVPFEEQEVVIKKLRQVIKQGGYVIVLENILDQGPHLFSNSIREWQRKFHKAGFKIVKIQRFGYNLFTRFIFWTYRNLFKNLFSKKIIYFTSLDERGSNLWKNKGVQIILRIAVFLNSLVEPILVSTNLRISCIQCGFLFKAVQNEKII